MYILRSVFFILVIWVTACKSANLSKVNDTKLKAGSITASSCDQTIKYFASTLSDTKGGQDITANTEIVINPSTKIITLTSEPPNQEKVSFETIIERFDCNFNSDLTKGESIYTGYVKSPDGTTSPVIIKVETKDGEVAISSVSPDDNGIVIKVTHWELVKEH